MVLIATKMEHGLLKLRLIHQMHKKCFSVEGYLSVILTGAIQ